MWLKEAQLAHLLCAHTARRKVGHAARFELDAHIRNVHFVGKNRQPHPMQRAHRRVDQTQHDIQVVDHQVQHHVHVQRARAENAEPMRLEKHGVVQDRFGGRDRGIEALQMPGLQNAAVLGGNLDEAIGLLDAGRDRLLHQNVHVGRQQSFRHFEVGGRWRTHRCRRKGHFISGSRGEAFSDGGENRRSPIGRSAAGPDQVRLHDGRQANRRSLVFERPITRRWLRPKTPAPQTRMPS